MKKIITSIITTVAIAFTLMPSLSTLGLEKTTDTYKAIYKEELQAKKMYESFSSKYPDVKQFNNIIKGEEKHILIAKSILDTKGLKYDDVIAEEVIIPSTKEEALKYALEFENNDIKSLEERIKVEKDENTLNSLNILLNGSLRHKMALERALGLNNAPNGAMNNGSMGMGMMGKKSMRRGNHNGPMGMMNMFRNKNMNSSNGYNCPYINNGNGMNNSSNSSNTLNGNGFCPNFN